MENVNYPRNDTYILIPSYKPDHLLIELLVKLKVEGFDAIVIDDGSGEEYEQVFKEAEKYAHVLRHDHNRGKGAALRFGFTYINLNPQGHNYVITCDSDGQHALKDIIRMSDKLHETDNIVFGCRSFGKDVPRRSKAGNNMSRLCRTLITKDYIQDDQCGLRGFPIKYVFHLIPVQGDHYEYEMNVICMLQIKRIKIVELPIETIYLNNNESSHFKPNLDTFRIQRTIWLNVLVPLVCALLSISMLLIFTLLIPNWYHLYPFMISYLFYFELSMGITAFVWPTKKMGRRVLIEGVYTTIKCGLVFGFYALFSIVLPVPPVFGYTIALLLTFLCNFPLAYFAWKIKNRNNYKK